ncbi:MAG TPA: carbohydrate kinase family protein [Candidatus Doudnabacteria bacterium]|nr:carbohydrate kinase family protein [Candidatus Doudnabacteria bacterium]
MRKSKFDIIAIGDPTIDTFLFVEDVEVKKINGQLKAIINWGDKLPVHKFARTVAGNAANAAVGSSRLGLKTAFYTVLAHDTGGREIVHKMRKEKVATDYIVIDEDHPTNASTVLSHEGERTIFVYHEHRKYKLPKLAKADWIYLTSMGVGFERIYKDLAKYLDKTGAKLAFNPGTFQLRKGPKFNKLILERTTVLSINKEEAQSWVGNTEDFEVLSKKLQAMGPETVVITDGRKGAYSFGPEGYYYITEFPGPRIEATGAGDGFTTAYVGALALGLSHKEAMRWAPVNAGSVVKLIGPQAGLLTKKQILSKLSHRKSFQPVEMKDEKTKSRIAAQVGKIKD